MQPKVYRVVWPDRAVSLVTLSADDRGYATVKIKGVAKRLSSLLDYRLARSVEAELHYLVREGGARITTEEEPTAAQP